MGDMEKTLAAVRRHQDQQNKDYLIGMIAQIILICGLAVGIFNILDSMI